MYIYIYSIVVHGQADRVPGRDAAAGREPRRQHPPHPLHQDGPQQQHAVHPGQHKQ